MEDEDSDSQCSGVVSMRDVEDEFLSDNEDMEVSDAGDKSGNGSDVEENEGDEENPVGPEGKICKPMYFQMNESTMYVSF